MSTDKTVEALRDYVREHADDFLDDPNVTSVGVGDKVTGGVRTGRLAVSFTVARKLAGAALESAGTIPLPETVSVGGVEVPTDVLQRRFAPGANATPVGQPGEPAPLRPPTVAEAQDPERTRRRDPMQPGVSLANVTVTAGTFGCVVYDAASGTPYALSNWHVLNGPEGRPGDAVVQPGPYDEPNVANNKVGVLVRSYLGRSGDGGVATIDARPFTADVFELGVTPASYRRAELGDRLVKSGRTTGVTRGVVTRVETVVEIDYGGGQGVQRVGGFEIGVDPADPPADGEVSMGGDSGSVWLQRAASGQASGEASGLHFAGESGATETEHAIACDLQAILGELQVALVPAASAESASGHRRDARAPRSDPHPRAAARISSAGRIPPGD